MKIIRNKKNNQVVHYFNDSDEIILSENFLSGTITDAQINNIDFEVLENIQPPEFNPNFGILVYDKKGFSISDQVSYDLAKLNYENNLIVNQVTSVRNTRNHLLKDSDWTQVADVPVDKDAWAIYRQELRDITGQEGFPFTIIWPTQP